MASEPETPPAAGRIDVRGRICPYPIIETRKALRGIGVGEVLEVVTDNPPTANETLPQLCNLKGMRFERSEVEPGVWRFRIVKSDAVK
jgi:tRNA 2-thiouridine synthesizing protein A